jgi:hypothetical protein
MADEVRGTGNASRQPMRQSDPWKPILIVLGIVAVALLLLDNGQFAARAQERSDPESQFSDTAFLAGIKRNNSTDRFRRGEAKAVMGGVEIDMRDATMDGSEAVLNVSSVMGGIKVRVPDEWTVVSRVDTVLGGFEDKTRRPREDKYRLILEGSVVMGGLTVQN